MHAAFKYDLAPILCIGEQLDTRESNPQRACIDTRLDLHLRYFKEQAFPQKLLCIMNQCGQSEQVKLTTNGK